MVKNRQESSFLVSVPSKRRIIAKKVVENLQSPTTKYYSNLDQSNDSYNNVIISNIRFNLYVSKFLISIRGAVVVGKIRGQEVRCRKQVKPLTILCRRLATWILKFCKPKATIGKLG